MTNKLILEQIAPDEHKLLLTRIDALCKVFVSTSACINSFVRASISAGLAMNKLNKACSRIEKGLPTTKRRL